MEHSENYEKVQAWYHLKMWSIDRVRNAVTMGWITEAEFGEITGEAYV